MARYSLSLRGIHCVVSNGDTRVCVDVVKYCFYTQPGRSQGADESLLRGTKIEDRRRILQQKKRQCSKTTQPAPCTTYPLGHRAPALRAISALVGTWSDDASGQHARARFLDQSRYGQKRTRTHDFRLHSSAWHQAAFERNELQTRTGARARARAHIDDGAVVAAVSEGKPYI